MRSNSNPTPPSRTLSSSSSPRGRGVSPRPPPSYARSSLDRSPSLNPMVLDERPRVPPPIYLRSSSPQPRSNVGTLKIHVPAWSTCLVKPPRPLDLHPLEVGSSEHEPPSDDTVLSGALEVIMKERKKVQSISVGVQSVCRLHMGKGRGWEEDGIFERGVQVLGEGNEDGIWLEKGRQSFSFSILLPATLATSDYHDFGRLTYIITASVQGIAQTSAFSSIFKAVTSPPILDPDIPFVGDFERVIARSDKLVAESRSRSGSRTRSGSTDNVAAMRNFSLGGDDGTCAITIGGDSPPTGGLYTTRRHPSSALSSASSASIPTLSLGSEEEDRGRPRFSSFSDISSGSGVQGKADKADWMKGDLCASRELLVHAVDPLTGGEIPLDIRKEGFVEGLGSWRFTANAEALSISSVILLSMNIPTPTPATTIFLLRLALSQTYTFTSPRTPNQRPHLPEPAKHHVLYQIGRQHKAGEKYPGPECESLWRGYLAGGHGGLGGQDHGWNVRAVARIPSHDKTRPSTHDGTITPIRVTHELLLQVYYSIHGESVKGEKIKGHGELRLMSVRVPIHLPSCHCLSDALSLPTYEKCHRSTDNIDSIISSPPNMKTWCMCGKTFAELGEAAMKRMQAADWEDMEERMRRSAVDGSSKDLQSPK
ncbi:hypothetical protein CNBG_5291 [Cryptococcus deuterogattii R265]|uniref:uncharacterized protein n=1 Tax=Cryptococcus deuterogattii (strain R265) TaxID=294750 RepID=UPI001936041B|nr:hypothetical protein CNBG_5291 [Cryptococcus deuterogattii R265]